jgi:hypothetical protein
MNPYQCKQHQRVNIHLQHWHEVADHSTQILLFQSSPTAIDVSFF